MYQATATATATAATTDVIGTEHVNVLALINWGCVSVLLPRLAKLPSQCNTNTQDNFYKLDNNKETQPEYNVDAACHMVSWLYSSADLLFWQRASLITFY